MEFRAENLPIEGRKPVLTLSKTTPFFDLCANSIILSLLLAVSLLFSLAKQLQQLGS